MYVYKYSIFQKRMRWDSKDRSYASFFLWERKHLARISAEFAIENYNFFQNLWKGILLLSAPACSFGVWLLLLLLLHTVVVKAWLAEFDDFVVTQCEEWARKYCMQPDLPLPHPHSHPSWLSLSVCWAVTDFQISWLLSQITNESSARLRGPKMDEEAKKERKNQLRVTTNQADFIF